jgi:fatty-acyl-CoA synthase
MTTTRPHSRTLGDLLDELAAATPQAPALVSGAERLDFAALKARSDAFARALLALGIGRGDRVALLCSNRSEWVVAACAAAKLGAPVAAISTFSSPRELAYALEQSGAKALVMLGRFRDRHFLQALGELCPELARCPPGALQSAALPDLASVVVLEGDA